MATIELTYELESQVLEFDARQKCRIGPVQVARRGSRVTSMEVLEYGDVPSIEPHALDYAQHEPGTQWGDAIAVYRAAQPSDFKADRIGRTNARLRLTALGFLSAAYPVGTFAKMDSIDEWGRFLSENEGLAEILRNGSVMWSRERDALRDAEALLDAADGGMGA